jgi:F0F1-type ATP synthase assembly protein I
MAGKDDGDMGRNLAFGLQIAVGATLGYFAGDWFDRHYGSAPWGVFVGVMLGLAAGMYLMIKEAIRNNKD